MQTTSASAVNDAIAVSDAWVIRVGDDMRHAFYAGRKTGQLFRGDFHAASIERCYKFAPRPCGAFQFNRPSEAFQVLTILDESGLPASLRIWSPAQGDTTHEAGFLVEVAGTLRLASQYLCEDGSLTLKRACAAVMDFRSAMHHACAIEESRQGKTRLVAVCW